MTNGVFHIGETNVTADIPSPELEVRALFEKTREELNKLFKHEDYYKDIMLAAFAADAKIGLEGFRGTGKSYLMDTMMGMIDKKIKARVQSYLDADLEDVIVRPIIPSLLRGDEELMWKAAVKARVKGLDEIQRLGIKALSVMFGLMDNGKAYYLEQSEGVYPFWSIFTMNPTEESNDSLNFQIPEPLIDRIDCMMWIPRAKMEYEMQIGTQEVMRDKLDHLPELWNDANLLEFWKQVAAIPIPAEIDRNINLSCRIISFCLYAMSYDATSLSITKKRGLCAQCQANYFCHQIARPPSIRAKQSWMKLAKGFAYLRGHKQVEMRDIDDAFPAVFWRRVSLMDEDQTDKFEKANRLKLFQKLRDNLKSEINKSESYFTSLGELQDSYNENTMDSLESFAKGTAWFTETLDSLKTYYKSKKEKLTNKMREAIDNKNADLASKVYLLASGLPPEMITGNLEDIPFDWKMNITADWLVELSTINNDLFMTLKDKSGKEAIITDVTLRQLIKLKVTGKIKMEGEAVWN